MNKQSASFRPLAPLDYIRKDRIIENLIRPKEEIIAVGIEVAIDIPSIKTHLSPYISENEMTNYEFMSSYKAGVYYGDSCKVGRWTDITKSQEYMRRWYETHKDIVQTAYLTRMYRTPKIILLEGTYDGKYFSVVLSNMTKGEQTFLHKKNAQSGEYGKPIDIERFSLPGMPYIYVR